MTSLGRRTNQKSNLASWQIEPWQNCWLACLPAARRLLAACLGLVMLLLSSCATPGPTPDPTQTLDALWTRAADTLVAGLTETATMAPVTPTPRPPQTTPEVAEEGTPVPGPGDGEGIGEGEGEGIGEGSGLPVLEEEVSPTPLPTPIPTATPVPPPTEIPSPPTPTEIPCDWALFVNDLGANRTGFLPGEQLTKIYRLKNIGSCTWTPQYRLVFVSPFAPDGRVTVPIPVFVAPGQTVDVLFDLVAPVDSGNYQSYWFLLNAEGQTFAVGDQGPAPSWVQMSVVESVIEVNYSFVSNYCNAIWRSGRGLLPCPGDTEDARDTWESEGFVLFLERPPLESGLEDEGALWTQPNARDNGWISATYPPIRIQNGDRFQAWVGCMDASPGCDVMFQVDYQIGSQPVQSLGQWHEWYDGTVTSLDIDLSALADQWVQFTLSVSVNGGFPDMARAIWFVPHIQNQ